MFDLFHREHVLRFVLFISLLFATKQKFWENKNYKKIFFFLEITSYSISQDFFFPEKKNALNGFNINTK